MSGEVTGTRLMLILLSLNRGGDGRVTGGMRHLTHPPDL